MLSFKKERSEPRYKDIPIGKISRNPHQPRVHFAESEIKSLAESIRQYGLLNPLTVREKGDGFELVSGEGVRIPTDTKELTAEEREAVEKLQEKLEEDDDVVNVYTTMAEADEE